jgi:hypothetical protein
VECGRCRQRFHSASACLNSWARGSRRFCSSRLRVGQNLVSARLASGDRNRQALIRFADCPRSNDCLHRHIPITPHVLQQTSTANTPEYLRRRGKCGKMA